MSEVNKATRALNKTIDSAFVNLVNLVTAYDKNERRNNMLGKTIHSRY